MPEYKVETTLPDEETFEPEEDFDTHNEAQEFGYKWRSDYSVGGEVLNVQHR